MPAGLMKAGLMALKGKVGLVPEHDQLKGNTANTAFTHHQKKSFALNEVNLPFHIQFERDDQKVNIKSVEHYDFDGQLKHQVSAHPKVDRRTGEFLAFAYDMSKAVIHYSLFNKDSKLLTTLQIPLTSNRMIHDFANTENYIIIPDLPVEFNPAKTFKEKKWIFQFNKNAACRYGILKKLN